MAHKHKIPDRLELAEVTMERDILILNLISILNSLKRLKVESEE